jgi:hypothetical protein
MAAFTFFQISGSGQDLFRDRLGLTWTFCLLLKLMSTRLKGKGSIMSIDLSSQVEPICISWQVDRSD